MAVGGSDSGNVSMTGRALGILLLSSVAAASPAKADGAFGKLFPDGLIDREGNPVSLGVLNGKAVGIYFSAQWCGPCRRFTPKLLQYRSDHAADFEVVFVSADRSEVVQFEYMKSTGMKWPTVRYKSASAKALLQKFNVRGYPTLVMLNAKGEFLSSAGREFILRGEPAARLKSANIVKEEYTCSRCDEIHHRTKLVFEEGPDD